MVRGCAYQALMDCVPRICRCCSARVRYGSCGTDRCVRPVLLGFCEQRDEKWQQPAQLLAQHSRMVSILPWIAKDHNRERVPCAPASQTPCGRLCDACLVRKLLPRGHDSASLGERNEVVHIDQVGVLKERFHGRSTAMRGPVLSDFGVFLPRYSLRGGHDLPLRRGRHIPCCLLLW
eukprot:2543962-Prymnesium_polylepis.1